MTENRARAVEEPAGYDYPETDRIPVPGDLSDGHGDRSDGRADAPRPDADAPRFDADTTRPDADAPRFDADAPRSDVDAPRFDADGPRSTVDAPRPGTPFEAPVESPATPAEPVESVESGLTQDLTPAPAAGTGKVEEEQEFFDTSEIDGFRDRWRELQAGFVDDPAQAVRGANDLVDEIMRELAERKDHLEGKWRDASDGKVGTEELRVVIREYRAFFDRLLNA